jgi:hypothetical protein
MEKTFVVSTAVEIVRIDVWAYSKWGNKIEYRAIVDGKSTVVDTIQDSTDAFIWAQLNEAASNQGWKVNVWFHESVQHIVLTKPE